MNDINFGSLLFEFINISRMFYRYVFQPGDRVVSRTYCRKPTSASLASGHNNTLPFIVCGCLTTSGFLCIGVARIFSAVHYFPFKS